VVAVQFFGVVRARSVCGQSGSVELSAKCREVVELARYPADSVLCYPDAQTTMSRPGRIEQRQTMVEPHCSQRIGGIDGGSAVGATMVKPKAISTRQRSSLRDILKLGLRQP
jgi:hypothetical protein